ncbi:MAG: hypothetical protein HC896_03075, partial [Bacteroidales bacterium]|nr:hypothetical protein [Bacteroidales bacterium]
MLCGAASFAASYYVSPNGSDNNSGTSSQSPWASIEKLNESIDFYAKGNSIYLERGGRYSGTIGKEGWRNTYIGAYGTGANPLMDGTITVTGTWANTGNNGMGQ